MSGEGPGTGGGGDRPGDPEIVVAADAHGAAAGAAERIATILREAVEACGIAHFATTGGSAAPELYRQLADTPVRDDVPWERLHVWWGDDRFVPRDHPLSNVKPFDDILLARAYAEEGQVGLGSIGAPTPVPIPLDQVHPFPTGIAIGEARGAAWCAAQLAKTVRGARMEHVDGWPVFDLVLLGVGPDGHVLSVFPGSEAFGSREVAMAIPAPTHVEPHVERVTFNPAVIGAARRVVVIAPGAAKAGVLREALSGAKGGDGAAGDPTRLPLRLAVRAGATWFLDEAAASELSR